MHVRRIFVFRTVLFTVKRRVFRWRISSSNNGGIKHITSSHITLPWNIGTKPFFTQLEEFKKEAQGDDRPIAPLPFKYATGVFM